MNCQEALFGNRGQYNDGSKPMQTSGKIYFQAACASSLRAVESFCLSIGCNHAYDLAEIVLPLTACGGRNQEVGYRNRLTI